jgi:hypothetical protein
MSLLRSLLPLKPTAKGLASVKTDAFSRLLQEVAHRMLSKGYDWEAIDVQLRDITVRELLPKRNYDADEVVEFYRRNFQLIDAAWLSSVLQMKKDYIRMTENPEKFLKEIGILPGSPLFSQQVAATVNRPVQTKI